MAVRIEFHSPRRKRVAKREGGSTLVVVVAIAAVVLGTHLLLWFAGLIH